MQSRPDSFFLLFYFLMSLKFVAKRATDQPVYLASKKAKNKENELEDEEKIEEVSQAKKKSEQRKKIEETERYKIYA